MATSGITFFAAAAAHVAYPLKTTSHSKISSTLNSSRLPCTLHATYEVGGVKIEFVSTAETCQEAWAEIQKARREALQIPAGD